MGDSNQSLSDAYAAFDAGRIADVRRILASLPAKGQPWEALLLGGAAARLEEDHQAALKLLSEAARTAPEPSLAANAWAEASRVYGALNDLPRARAALDHALRINPDLAPAWVDRAALALTDEPLSLVETYLDRARAQGHDSARLHEVLAQLSIRRGRPEDAAVEYRMACEMDPDSLPAQVGTASVQAMRGELAAAEATLEGVLERSPRFPAYRQYAQLHHFQANETRLADWVARLGNDRDLAHSQQVDLCFACAKGFDDLGDYARAFDYLTRGNSLYCEVLNYDVEVELARRRVEWSNRVENILPAARRFASGVGPAPYRMIFIVGLPRSGSTLLEQMFAGHSWIQTIGETGLMGQLMDILLALDPDQQEGDREAALMRWFADLRARYLSESARLAPPGFRHAVVDKSLENFWYVGLIRALFPDALIVHIQREPMDTCFGCYRQLFTGPIDYSYSFDDLAAYYGGYRDRMEAWAAVYPECCTDLHYERLVEDPKPMLSRLLAALDLEYEEACLEFATSNRFVPTLSQVQVREPVNRSGIGRWKRYEKELAPLLAALGDWPRRYQEELAAAAD